MLVASGGAHALDGGEPTILEIVLDQRATGIAAEFRRIGGDLWVERATLERVGLPAPTGDDAWVRLTDVADVAARVDDVHQRIALDTAVSSRPGTALDFSGPAIPSQRLATGASLDYDLNVEHAGNTDTTALRLTPRAFNAAGSFTVDAVWLDGADHGWRRFDTFWESDFPDSLQQLRIGDAITGGPEWARAVRFAGVHWSSDFSLRPDLVTFPLPAFSAQAAVPSAVDLYVNGLRTATSNVPGGPFSIPQLPVVTGGGDALVVVRDALGREQSYSVPFYVSPVLLRAGLDQFSVDAGALRRGFGSADDRYGPFIASASQRHGVTDSLTLEGHAEASADLAAAGAGVVGRIGSLGAWHAALAQSTGRGCSGTQAYFSTEWQRGRWSAQTVQQVTRKDFCDVASLDAERAPSRLQQVSVGVSAGAGQFNLTRVTRRDAQSSQHTLALSWSRRVARRCWLTVGGLVSRDDRTRSDHVAQFSLLVPIGGDGASAELAGYRGAQQGTSLRVQQPVPVGLGWGGYAESYLDRADVRGGVTDRTAYADLTLEAARQDGSDALRLGAQGALAWLDGGVFATRRLGDAFAVINTGDAPGVTVYRENQPYARSDDRGRVLVGELVPFAPNNIRVDARDLPPDIDAGMTAQALRPFRGGGIVARFDIRHDRRLRWSLRLEDGRAVPVGSVLSVDGRAVQGVGYDGAVYLDPPAAGAVVEARGSFGACRVAIAAPIPSPADGATTRPVTCNTLP